MTPQPAQTVQEVDVHWYVYASTALARISTQRCTLPRTRRSKIDNCLNNLDAEKHGVGLVYSHKLRPYKKNIQQINGRLLLATFDTQPLCTNIIVAYAPHALRPQKEKDDFYDKLNNTLSKLPKHEMNLVIGDFNIRLMENYHTKI